MAHFKDGNTDVADQSRCSRCVWLGMHTSRLFGKKGKWSVHLATFIHSTNFVLRFVKNARRRKQPTINTTRAPTLHVRTLVDNLKERLGSALPTTLQSGYGPFRLPLVRTIERSPEKSPLQYWRGCPGSCAKLVARSWNGLLPQRDL